MNVEEAPQAHEPDLMRSRPIGRAHRSSMRRTSQVLPERAAAPRMSALGREVTWLRKGRTPSLPCALSRASLTFSDRLNSAAH
jgi:hypothetical protein